MFSHEQLHSILSTLPDPAFILTRSGRYAAIFGGTDTRYYHDGSGLVGQNMYDVLHTDKADWFSQQIASTLDSRTIHIVEYTLSGSDVKGLEDIGPSQPIWFEGRIQALEFLVEGEEAVVWVASNMTEKNALQAWLKQQSETDALTGLFNRRKLLEVIAGFHADFVGNARPTAVLMFDIDNFKQVNDAGGHQSGDNVLREVAAACRDGLRDIDVLARLGGDEFVVLMPGLTTEEAKPVADLLRLQVTQSIEAKLALNVSISGGLSEFGSMDANHEDALIRADEGLYLSKRDGRNRIGTVRPEIGRTRSTLGA